MASPFIPKREATPPQTLALQAPVPATVYYVFWYTKCWVIYLESALPMFLKRGWNIK